MKIKKSSCGLLVTAWSLMDYTDGDVVMYMGVRRRVKQVGNVGTTYKANNNLTFVNAARVSFNE